VALLFAFHVNYLPFHLAVETHWDDRAASGGPTEGPAKGGFVATADHDEHHSPHAAADHALKLAPRTPAGHTAPDVVATETRAPQCQSSVRVRLFLTERQNPPGHLAVSPAQPRAPPLA
jgi:hypothetical protein